MARRLSAFASGAWSALIVSALAWPSEAGPCRSIEPQDAQIAPGAEARGVRIYLLKDPTLHSVDAAKLPLSDLAVADEPWIASEDVERYDSSSRCLHLKGPARRNPGSIDLRGAPFVVTADGERVCMGTLWTLVSSSLPPPGVPVISDPLWSLSSPDVISIQDDQGKLDAPRFLEVLRRDGKLSAGIECKLEKVEVVRSGDGKGGAEASVRYTYTVRNLDRDALYVLDTDKLDYDVCRRNQIGILGVRPLETPGDRARDWRWDDKVILAPNPPRHLKGPELPYGQVDPKWLTRLKPGESMTRTATEPHFDDVPPGKYRCLLAYGYPGFSHGFSGRTSRKDRKREDGRVWIGRVEATLEVEVR